MLGLGGGVLLGSVLAAAKSVRLALPIGVAVSLGLMMFVVLFGGDVVVARGVRFEVLALEERVAGVMMRHRLRVMSVLGLGSFGSGLMNLSRFLMRRVLAALKDMSCGCGRLFGRLPSLGGRDTGRARGFRISFGCGFLGGLATPSPATATAR